MPSVSPHRLVYGKAINAPKACFWCEVPLAVGKSKCSYEHNRRTADHVVPLASLGRNHRKNLVGACQFCNQLRGSMTETEFEIISSDIVRPYRDNIREMVFQALHTPLIAESRRGEFVGTLLWFVPENEKPDLFARADLLERFPKKASKKYFGRIRRQIVIAMVTRRGALPYVAAIPRIPPVEHPVSDRKLILEEPL